MKDSAECDNKSVLDLSKQQLQKIPKQQTPPDVAQQIRVLILDENELQKIDNVDSYMQIEHLSVCKNQLLRMYGVCRLHHLQQLHLAYNGILTIEGMKELTQLRHLNLEGNNIKAIEHLTTNCKLEYLNLAENSIVAISDLSYLKCLKELNVQGNRITHLRQCDKFLPTSLESLQLAKNGITDLNEICTLGLLSNLNAISVADNPCVQMTGSVVGFDYRPFVLNWCMTVKSIDGYHVNPIESLKAEWLYSQGRGRQFRIGEQQSLARYLSSVCPLSGEVLENENERKLRLILSKAQQHQRQLQEETETTTTLTDASSIGQPNANNSGTSTNSNNSPSTGRRRQQSSSSSHQHHAGSRIQSPRFSRLGRQGSPDSSMSSSMHVGNSWQNDLTVGVCNNTATTLQMTSSLISNISAASSDRSDGQPAVDGIMVQSLDPHILSGGGSLIASVGHRSGSGAASMSASMMGHNFADNMCLSRSGGGNNPLSAATKMVPVPESLMSPDCPPPNGSSVVVVQRSGTSSAYNPTSSHYQQNHQQSHGSSTSSSTRKATNKPQDSPKSSRTSSSTLQHQPTKMQRQPSPVLNQTRKVHQNLMNSLQLQQQQLLQREQQQQHQHKEQQAGQLHYNPNQQQSRPINRQALPSNSVHMIPVTDVQSATDTTNSDVDQNQEDVDEYHDNDNGDGDDERDLNGASTGPDANDVGGRGVVDDCDEMNVDKLKTIRNKAAQRCLQNRSVIKSPHQTRRSGPTKHITHHDNRNVTHPSNRTAIAAARTNVTPPPSAEDDALASEQLTVSAILIQKLWRGHQARIKFKEAAKVLQTQRTQNYIEKLTADMETTKIALENERKIQQLQMQAINALWKKVSNMPAANVSTASGGEQLPVQHNDAQTSAVTAAAAAVAADNSQQSNAIVQDLARTCSALTSQVQQLQGSMHDILQCMTVFCQLPQQQQLQQQQPQQSLPPPPTPPPPTPPTVTSMVADTQTEIIAVHTPQIDQLPFPFRNAGRRLLPQSVDGLTPTPPPAGKHQRPSTLPLDASANGGCGGLDGAAVEALDAEDDDDCVDAATHVLIAPKLTTDDESLA